MSIVKPLLPALITGWWEGVVGQQEPHVSLLALPLIARILLTLSRLAGSLPPRLASNPMAT